MPQQWIIHRWGMTLCFFKHALERSTGRDHVQSSSGSMSAEADRMQNVWMRHLNAEVVVSEILYLFDFHVKIEA